MKLGYTRILRIFAWTVVATVPFLLFRSSRWADSSSRTRLVGRTRPDETRTATVAGDGKTRCNSADFGRTKGLYRRRGGEAFCPETATANCQGIIHRASSLLTRELPPPFPPESSNPSPIYRSNFPRTPGSGGERGKRRRKTLLLSGENLHCFWRL